MLWSSICLNYIGKIAAIRAFFLHRYSKMTTEILHADQEIDETNDSWVTRLIIWGKYKYRNIIRRKDDEFPVVVPEEKSSISKERIEVGITTTGQLAKTVSKVVPHNTYRHVSIKGVVPEAVVASAIAVAVIGPLYNKYHDSPSETEESKAKIFDCIKMGLETGVVVAVGIAALFAHLLGLGSVTTGSIDAAGFVGGSVVGAVALPLICKHFAQNDVMYFKRVENGFGWGILLGGVIGGVIGSVIPVVGTAMGTIVGASLGALVGGGSAAAVPVLHSYFKSEKLKLFARTGSVVGATVGAIVGSLVPGLGTVIGAAVGACLGAVIGICTYKIYKSVKKIINVANANAVSATADTTESQAEAKEKNTALVNDLKTAVMIGSIAGAAIGSVVPVIGTTIGAGVGAVLGLAWVGFRQATAGTKVGVAIDNGINAVVKVASKIKTIVSDKLGKFFSPAPKQVELEDFAAAKDVDVENKTETNTYPKVMEEMVREKRAKAKNNAIFSKPAIKVGLTETAIEMVELKTVPNKSQSVDVSFFAKPAAVSTASSEQVKSESSIRLAAVG